MKVLSISIKDANSGGNVVREGNVSKVLIFVEILTRIIFHILNIVFYLKARQSFRLPRLILN